MLERDMYKHSNKKKNESMILGNLSKSTSPNNWIQLLALMINFASTITNKNKYINKCIFAKKSIEELTNVSFEMINVL